MKHRLNTELKFAALTFLCSVGLSCVADDTNILAVSDWSEPVRLENMETGHTHDIRGRLLIVAGNEPAYGGPKTDNAAMTFVELQNVTGAYGEALDVCFDSTKLNCVLTGVNGQKVPSSRGGFWGGRGPLSSWVVLPYNSTIRLFVNRGSKSPLDIYSSGEPSSSWSISPGDTNTYYLSGTLEICTRTNDLAIRTPSYYVQNCIKTLTFPKVKVSVPK